MQITSIKKGNHNHSEWKKALSFYKDEIHVFKNRLTEVAQKYTNKEIMQQVEHFENQFLLQSENIDILQHEINLHLNAIANDVKEKAGHISNAQIADDDRLNNQFESEKKVFAELKTEFMYFLSKVM
jgi:hypothetical protein